MPITETKKVIKVIAGRKYILPQKEAYIVQLVRESYKLKGDLERIRKALEAKKKELIKLGRERLHGRKSVVLGIDPKVRVELPEIHGWNQSKLEETAQKHGSLFFEFFQASVLYQARGNRLDDLLKGEVAQAYEQLAMDIRLAKTIKQGKPKLRFIKSE